MNPFKQALKSAGSHPLLGSWLVSASPLVAEAVGQAGFDWVVVDMEHTPLDLAGLVHVLQALAGTKTQAIVRVPANDAVWVKRVLDAGATTLLFPLVHDAAEAARAVAATRYPPEGVRGMSGMTRASKFGTAPNHFANANRQVGVILQIETKEAVDRLEEIAAVDGVDSLFVGPGDLSAALGHVGQASHPAVMDVIAQCAQRCKRVGKPIGILGMNPESVAQFRAAGYDYVGISSDLGLLMQACKSVLTALRTPDSEHVHSLSSGTRLF
jgi:2-keto-3-deoxy-L-rhamnonate aldolase RhmA